MQLIGTKMTIKKNYFVEMDFIAKVEETGEIFDTTLESEAKKAGLFNENEKDKFKPLKVCVGQGMVVKGFDKEIEGKDTGKEYQIRLKPEDAFGKRDSKLIKTMPLSAFRARGVEPAAGMMLSLDNFLVKISAVTSGRVIVDFNNPLSGKHIIYKFTVNNIIEDKKEQIEILSKFFVGMESEVAVDEKRAVVRFQTKLPEKIEEEFKKKIKETAGIESEIKSADKGEEGKIEPERPYNE